MHRRSQLVAILAAAAVIPRSFQSSLLPRSTADQGLVTGITVALVYMMGLLLQDGVDSVAEVATDRNHEKDSSKTTEILTSAAALGLGYYLQKKNKYNESERLHKSATRTFGYWLKNVGIAGIAVSAIQSVNDSATSDKNAKQNDLIPLVVGAGIILSVVGEYTRAKDDEDFSVKESLLESKPIRAIAISTVVLGALGGIAYLERSVAKTVDSLLDKTSPKLKKSWLPIGHLIAAGGMVYGLTLFLKNTYAKIEHKADEFDLAYKSKPSNSYSSGGRGSLVDWKSLSVQGRRHISTRLSAAKIKSVTKKAAKEPIRIYVGLNSAENEEARVDLAMAELERSGAFTRELIVVISPTGTGYVNYVMSDAVEYFARGNVASVTIQYSKRPSPMSLDRVGEGHVQYRMLLNLIRKRIEKNPKTKRPKVVLFGESLGAWTSQDALMHGGTDALKALNIERALWIGTPKGSKWKEQVISKKWLNVDPELVGTFDNYDEYQDLSVSEKRRLRYVMVTHYNDPIAHFGLEMLIKQPDWVESPSKRPKSLKSSIEYRTPTLFVQTLIDMKNALKPEPGKFVASAHDYRGDLAQFIATVYGFKPSSSEIENIEKALMKNEIQRAKELKFNNSDEDR